MIDVSRRQGGSRRPAGRSDPLSILVAYATKHGSTGGIAERIAERLRAAGLDAEALPVKSVRDVASYDAVILVARCTCSTG